MKNLKPFLTERKRQDICEGCGRSIADPEKECQTCGRFPHKAYHERSASQTLGISKWLQTGPAMQPNQKLSEDEIETENMKTIVNFRDFVESKVQESETTWSYFDEACLEEGIGEENFDNQINEGIKDGVKDFFSSISLAGSSFLSKISKALGINKVNPKVDSVLKQSLKGVAKAMEGAKNDPKIFKEQLAKNADIKKVSDVYAKSLEKFLSSVKTDPLIFLSSEFGETLSNLYIIRKATKASIKKENKDFMQILAKAGSLKSATSMSDKDKGKTPQGKPGSKPAPVKQAPKASAPKASAPKPAGSKPAESKPAAPQPEQPAQAQTQTPSTPEPENKTN